MISNYVVYRTTNHIEADSTPTPGQATTMYAASRNK